MKLKAKESIHIPIGLGIVAFKKGRTYSARKYKLDWESGYDCETIKFKVCKRRFDTSILEYFEAI
jgi:hypothetical protein